jgi:hypothetical protein
VSQTTGQQIAGRSMWPDPQAVHSEDALGAACDSRISSHSLSPAKIYHKAAEIDAGRTGYCHTVAVSVLI